MEGSETPKRQGMRAEQTGYSVGRVGSPGKTHPSGIELAHLERLSRPRVLKGGP